MTTNYLFAWYDGETNRATFSLTLDEIIEEVVELYNELQDDDYKIDISDSGTTYVAKAYELIDKDVAEDSNLFIYTYKNEPFLDTSCIKHPSHVSDMLERIARSIGKPDVFAISTFDPLVDLAT